MSEYFITPNATGPTAAVEIDEALCIGCNSCANICRIQTILPNPEKGKPPVVAYPDECWYCGCCVEACPTGALQMRLPINQRILFKDKESGEIFRIGAGDAPAKSFFKAPFGWIDHPEFDRIMQWLEKSDIRVSISLPAGAGTAIGRYFGEKDGGDYTPRLVKFLEIVGFDYITAESCGSNAAAVNDKVRIHAACNIRQDIFDAELTIRGLSDLLHRLCVSNYSAVHTWRSI